MYTRKKNSSTYVQIYCRICSYSQILIKQWTHKPSQKYSNNEHTSQLETEVPVFVVKSDLPVCVGVCACASVLLCQRVGVYVFQCFCVGLCVCVPVLLFKHPQKTKNTHNIIHTLVTYVNETQEEYTHTHRHTNTHTHTHTHNTHTHHSPWYMSCITHTDPHCVLCPDRRHRRSNDRYERRQNLQVLLSVRTDTSRVTDEGRCCSFWDTTVGPGSVGIRWTLGQAKIRPRKTDRQKGIPSNNLRRVHAKIQRGKEETWPSVGNGSNSRRSREDNNRLSDSIHRD